MVKRQAQVMGSPYGRQSCLNGTVGTGEWTLGRVGGMEVHGSMVDSDLSVYSLRGSSIGSCLCLSLNHSVTINPTLTDTVLDRRAEPWYEADCKSERWKA